MKPPNGFSLKIDFKPVKSARERYHSWLVMAAFAFYFSGLATLFLAITGQINPARGASGPDQNKVLSYQIRLADAGGTAVADGTKNIKINFYTAASGGTPVYTDCGTTGTPVAREVVFTSGIATVLIGDTAAPDATDCADTNQPNAIPATLFDNTSLYLGITVESDAEMTPRKRIVSTDIGQRLMAT